jgi:hypothetical protein
MVEGPTRPSDATIKRLFARSSNRCAYPHCTVEIVQGDTVVGEICHIRAVRPDGPRHDPDQRPGTRHGYDNLILLCANHHKVVDDDPEAYTVDRLLKMKADHESQAATLAPSAIERATCLLVDQSVVSLNQSGGITAHTVHQTIHVHTPGTLAPAASERDAILSRLRDFHEARTNGVEAGAAPVQPLDDGLLVMHVLPFSAAAGERQASGFNEIARNPERFPPINGGVRDTRIDYDGLLIGSNVKGLREPQRAYVAVLRNGSVESVVSSLARGHDDRFLILPDLETMIVDYACRYARALDASGIKPPYAVFVSLLDIENRELLHVRILGGAFPEDLPSGILGRARYQFGECVFESAPEHERECATRLRSILDHLANAAGLATSPCFDAAGNYTPPNDG